MINWISCEDRMPDTVGDYLVAFDSFGFQNIEIAHITDDVFMVLGTDNEYYPVEYPSHWTELNKPRPTND